MTQHVTFEICLVGRCISALLALEAFLRLGKIARKMQELVALNVGLGVGSILALVTC